MAPVLLRTRAMPRFLPTAVAAIAASAIVAHAEPREITGVVVDGGSGEPIAEAVIVGGEGEPVITDAGGRFTLRVNGRPQLLVTAAGFGDRMVAVSGTALRIELTLSDDVEVIELEGTAPDPGPAAWELTPDQIRALPGAGNDVLKAVQSLPGVARIPFGLGGLVVRGQSPRDTNVYLDGIEVPLAFHFFGLASFYPATMLDGLEMQNGGHGAEHGRGQGGLVTLTSRRRDLDRRAPLVHRRDPARGSPRGGALPAALLRRAAPLGHRRRSQARLAHPVAVHLERPHGRRPRELHAGVRARRRALPAPARRDDVLRDAVGGARRALVRRRRRPADRRGGVGAVAHAVAGRRPRRPHARRAVGPRRRRARRAGRSPRPALVRRRERVRRRRSAGGDDPERRSLVRRRRPLGRGPVPRRRRSPGREAGPPPRALRAVRRGRARSAAPGDAHAVAEARRARVGRPLSPAADRRRHRSGLRQPRPR
ncbi:MAG: TonB-dependent receptor [Deltaproteobacteria bacterium]|nr:TonB-dependent receptor [Kofleriaceae bacterium]